MVTWADSLTVAFVVIFFGRSAFVSLIQERDDVLARNIRRACLAEDAGAPTESAVVAVLGLAHLPGVREALQKKSDL